MTLATDLHGRPKRRKQREKRKKKKRKEKEKGRKIWGERERVLGRKISGRVGKRGRRSRESDRRGKLVWEKKKWTTSSY